MITIRNEGQVIVSTSYWSTEHARRGLLYLSINAGACRLLVPAVVTLQLLSDLPPVGTPCDLARAVLSGRATYQLAWDDGAPDPYVVEIDQRQCDRLLLRSENGRVLPLIWYSQGDGDGALEVRRESIQIGTEVAS